ncbi:MAG: tetratricopeptide repeat-containing sensor histidine kinase [Reichenbachiella sp.]|uniref:tetratricopeptide repeat-containing sensor histidine kinase n=1 Tax=Reichenbachiella sp. TaxID=2184521 RepID=UPI00326459B9
MKTFLMHLFLTFLKSVLALDVILCFICTPYVVEARTLHSQKLENSPWQSKDTISRENLEAQVELIRHYSAQNPLQTIALSRGVKEYISDGINRHIVSDKWYYKGILLHRQGNFDSLLVYSRALKEWAREIGDIKGENLGLLLEGEYYYFKGQHKKAKQAFDLALSGFKLINDTLNIAKTMNSIGILYIEQSDYQEALLAYTEAYYIYKDMDHKVGMAAGLGNMGYVYTHLGNFDKALTYYNKSMQLLNNFDDKWLMATNLNRMGLNYLNGRKFKQCMEVFTKALMICEENGDKAYLSYVLNNIGKTHLYLGNYETAIEYYVRSLSIMEDLDYKFGIAWINHSLAKIYNVRGDDSTALVLLHKSLDIRRAIDHKYGIALTLAHIGSTHAKLEDYTRASVFYSESYSIFEKINNQRGLTEVLIKQGSIELNLNNFIKADSIFSSALILEEDIEDPLLMANTRHQLAILKRKQGKLKTALHNINLALNKSRALGVGLESRDFLAEKTLILEAMGNYKEALVAHRKYKILNDSLFAAASQRDINHVKVIYESQQEKKELLQKQEKQELKSREQEQQIEILEQRRKIQKFWVIGLLAGLLLLVAIALLIYFLLSNRVKAKNMLLEQEYLLEQMKSDMFLNIAHELRTPMTLILGPLGKLEANNNLSSRDQRCFKLIRSNSEKMLAMADEILLVSKLGQEKVKAILEPVPLKQTLYQVWAGFRTLADNKSIAYKFDVALSNDFWIKTEKLKLEKILGELISNALKYSQANDQVVVTGREYRGQFELTVSDTGPGIDPSEQHQIFRRYFQSSKAGKRKLGGIGLGLSIVKGMVEELGGSVRVSSQLGEGTSFIVLIPIILTNNESHDETSSNDPTIDLLDNVSKATTAQYQIS